MKTNYILALSFIGLVMTLNAQTPCDAGRYSTDLFPTVTTTSNIQFGQNTSAFGANVNLTLDFYEPTGDTETARPLIIWAHGGSFLSGTKTDIDVVALSQAFAKKGYACASINYRTGFLPIDSANSVKAVVRAVQDMRASIRFFYKDRADGVNTYKIDTNNIFVGGSSAGAITALHLAYLDRTCEINDYVPEANLTALGGLEGNSGNPCYSDDINGVINLCGALASYGWLEAGNLPVCSLHGTVDGTVKYNRGIVNPGVPLMYLDGSRMIHEQAQAVGVQSNFYTFLGADHVPYAGTSPTALAYLDTTVNFIRDYLIDRLGCTETIIQPANTPAETATLYSFTPCTGNIPDDFCTGSGLGDLEESIGLKIFPNPSNDEMNIVFNDTKEIESIALMDLSGRLIESIDVNSSHILLRKNNVHSGTYILTIKSKQGLSITKKVIFQ